MVGAMLAIGGALILIPVWLKAGVDKDVAASSTATLILTAAMVAFTVALANGIYEDVSVFVMLFYLVLSFVSAAVVKGNYSPMQIFSYMYPINTNSNHLSLSYFLLSSLFLLLEWFPINFLKWLTIIKILFSSENFADILLNFNTYRFFYVLKEFYIYFHHFRFYLSKLKILSGIY